MTVTKYLLLFFIRQAHPGPALAGIGVAVDTAVYYLKQILRIRLRMTNYGLLSF
jgi:hypothetical protein